MKPVSTFKRGIAKDQVRKDIDNWCSAQKW